MINKTLNIGIIKGYCKVAKCSMNNITKSRTDHGFSIESEYVEAVITGTGLRHNELINIKTGDILTNFRKVTGIIVSK